MSAVLPMLQDRVTEWRWEMHPVWWMWGAGGLIMMALVLLFWILVIVGLVIGIRWFMSQGRPATPDMALSILRERYARGDITREQFEAMRRDLEETRRR